MTGPIVLAWSGGRASTRALTHLRAQAAPLIVAVACGFRAADPLEAWAAQARAAGAHQCHLIDVADAYARQVAWPLAVQGLDPWPVPVAQAAPLIAEALVRVARLEHADVIAHGARGADARALAAAVHAHDAALTVVTLPPPAIPAEACVLALTVEGSQPTALNGVPLPVRELFETLEVLVGADQVVPVITAVWQQLDATGQAAARTGTVTLRVEGAAIMPVPSHSPA
ncbi:MAG: hypothetical protein FJW29_01490 [Acidobacteria bacterium]|nr:hypothetical protein [Acidobacteriota bacterium]